MNALELRDNAKQQLAQIKTIESGVDYLNKVKAIEVWAKAEKKDAELQNMIAEQKIRTQRILGQLLKDNEVSKNGQLAGKEIGGKDIRPSNNKLSDYGLTKDQSSTFQKIASLPEEIFEAEIATAKEETNKRIELTTSRLLSAAKEYELEKKKINIIQTERNDISIKNHEAIVHHIDCLEYLPKLKSEIDLLITDPPYFTDGDFTNHVLLYLNKVKPTGQAYIFSSSDPNEIQSYIALKPNNLRLEQILIWNYNNGGQLQPKTRYNSNYQVCFYYRGSDAPNINKPIDGKEQYACQTINAPDGRIGDRFHKWQKPNELIERFILNSSKVDDFIFDPFVGSGTTLVCAVKLGRRAQGCEVDIDAINIANQRGVKNGI